MNQQEKKPGALVFALDIGTRSVIGLLGTYEDMKLTVKHSAMAFHQSRAMFDGQIHDIEEVVKIAGQVKTELEAASGQKLTQVAIAAAGRALKTHRLEIEKEIDENKPIDKFLVNSIEIEGLQQAHAAVEKESGAKANYFCVGHTVVNYYINHTMITNPVGHKAKVLKLDLLATFLPYAVVDSLNTVMNKIGLEVGYLTLEPIAAMGVAVPQNVRLLNVALVDIGAGTSDIAITKDGSVFAYGMTATAGDEVTEAIARHYLLDFDSAETLKCNLGRQELHQVTDIVGIKHELKTEEVLGNVGGAIEVIARDIADNILQQNGKAPSAIFLIGGGSQVPGLSRAIAGFLEMPPERVVVRGTEIIQNLKHHQLQVCGPEGITPIGILAKAIENQEKDFIDLYVNGKEIRLFQSKTLKVSDALVLIGYNPRDLIPKRGKTLNVTVNHEQKTFYGEYGLPAEIFVNQTAASLDTPVKQGDVVAVKPAKMGKDAVCTLSQFTEKEGSLLVNGQRQKRVYDIRVNGEPVSGNPRLCEGDGVTYGVFQRVDDLGRYLGVDFSQVPVQVNGSPATKLTPLGPEDGIVYGQEAAAMAEAAPAAASKIEPEPEPVIRLRYNGKPLVIPKGKLYPIFVDIFNHVDFDRQQVRGRLVMLHNGLPANYTDPLMEGDEIEVRWEN